MLPSIYLIFSSPRPHPKFCVPQIKAYSLSLTPECSVSGTKLSLWLLLWDPSWVTSLTFSKNGWNATLSRRPLTFVCKATLGFLKNWFIIIIIIYLFLIQPPLWLCIEINHYFHFSVDWGLKGYEVFSDSQQWAQHTRSCTDCFWEAWHVHKGMKMHVHVHTWSPV